jgi:predicted acyl esterase
VTSAGGSPTIAAAFDPIAGTTDACKTVTAETDPGTAVYTMASPGFTLMGLPTVTGTVNTTGLYGELVARLWDVLPDGTQRLISRGIYRLADNQQGQITFQLHGNGYQFAAGDTVKLELLGRDAPYYRASNGTFTVQLSNVSISLPTT